MSAARKSAPKPTTTPPPVITPGELRIELGIEGLRSVISGGFLALGRSQALIASELKENNKLAKHSNELTKRVADALDLQNKLLEQRNNGQAIHDATQGDQT